MIEIGSKSTGVQKTVWRSHMVIGIMTKSIDIQKAKYKPQEIETVGDKVSEVLQTIYKHKEVLAEIGIPAANSGSGTKYILEMILGQRLLLHWQ